MDGKTVSARVGATDGGEEWLRKEGKEQEQKARRREAHVHALTNASFSVVTGN